MAFLINSVRNRRSASPVVQRLVELCVDYQQEQQNNQNNVGSSSSNGNSNDLNKQTEKKIKNLIKQINKSKRNDSLEELERAILHKDSRTKCTTISRSQENSLKLNPVVESCRLWRWSDLSNSSELKPVDFCPNAFHYNNDNICINPYHYERTASTYSVSVPLMSSLNEQQLSNSQNSTDKIIPMDIDEQQQDKQQFQWCHISYYEMANRVGEIYHAKQTQITIDGFTHPSNDERFCLGGLTNIQRNEKINQTRISIGRGVKLIYTNGSVFAECLSNNPIFIQSIIANKKLSYEPATVCKVLPGVRMKIFDSDDFTQILSNAIYEGYKSVYNLKEMCIIRMSFVKGWGVEYGRPSIMSTPCWVEIHLYSPLKWLDTVLSTMRAPDLSTTSV